MSTKSLPAKKLLILWVWFILLGSLASLSLLNLILAFLSSLANLQIRKSKRVDESWQTMKSGSNLQMSAWNLESKVF